MNVQTKVRIRKPSKYFYQNWIEKQYMYIKYIYIYITFPPSLPAYTRLQPAPQVLNWWGSSNHHHGTVLAKIQDEPIDDLVGSTQSHHHLWQGTPFSDPSDGTTSIRGMDLRKTNPNLKNQTLWLIFHFSARIRVREWLCRMKFWSHWCISSGGNWGESEYLRQSTLYDFK